MSTEQEIFDKCGRSYDSNDVIFREGDMGNEMFIIQSGKVKITKQLNDGAEKTLVILGPGDFFGEMAVIDKDVRSANAIAAEPSRLIALDEEVFEMHMQTNPKIVKKILKNLTARLRDANQQIANLMIKDANRLVANTILLVVHKHGEEGSEGITMDIPFTVTELSKMCGLDIAKTQEIVQKLLKARVIRMSGDTIVVTSLDSLEKFIKFLEMKEQFGE
ncbi:MAG TPA: Crp/Fnr family transcriptional regulator [bacterium]|nr:Crp/Fnr family transcriptional regulator [bacterium]